MENKLGILDLVLLVVSMLICALIGFYFTNKNKSLDSYMLGDRNLSLIPVALSLMTSCMSGLSLLGCSAELYYQGASYSFVSMSMLLCGPIISYTIVPVFYRLNQLSLYKYLELRFGLALKYIVSIIYIFQMIFYNAVVLYLPSMALQAILGVPDFYSILMIGLMCVLYSAIGGVKAVVWTDLFQASLMYLAIIVVGVMGTLEAGGFVKVFENAAAGGRLKLDGFFNLDLTTRHTFFGFLFGSTIKHVYSMGVNQIQMQRALSLPSLRQSQLAFMLCALFSALIALLSTYMGMVMYSAYRSCDPYLAREIPRRDAIIVHYVAHRLQNVPGLRGIFVAGIFSATLSTLSSFSNSMAALALEDYIKPVAHRLGCKDSKTISAPWLAKSLATAFGLTCVLMAYLIDRANSRLLQTATTLFGAIGVPFLAAFALGIFTRFTTSLGMLVGVLVALSLGFYITVYQTFIADPLLPTQYVFYDTQCDSLFNMTLSADTFSKSLAPAQQTEVYPQVEAPFGLHRISYMTLPVVQFVLTIVVASTVSLLTGGWNHAVDDEFLVGIAQKNDSRVVLKTIRRDSLGHNQTDGDGSAAEDRKRKLGVAGREAAERVI